MMESIVLTRDFKLKGMMDYQGQKFPITYPMEKGYRVSLYQTASASYVNVEGGDYVNMIDKYWSNYIGPEHFGITPTELFKLIKRKNLPFFKRIFSRHENL